MAADAGSLSNPAPGTLSKGAASFFSAASYGVGVTFESGRAPSVFIARRTPSVSGDPAATTRTPIWRGSDQPAG